MPEITKRCCACASDIPIDAELCSVCKTPQKRRGRLLQGLGANITLVVAAASFSVWLVTNIPKMMDSIHPVVRIRIITSSSERGTIINTGNRPVYIRSINYFLSYVEPGHVDQVIYQGLSRSDVLITASIPINEVLEPGKVARYQSKENPFTAGLNGNPIHKPQKFQGTDIADLLKAGALLGRAPSEGYENGCREFVSYASKDPEFQNDSLVDVYGVKVQSIVSISYYTFEADSKTLTLDVPSGVLLRYVENAPDKCFQQAKPK